MDKKIILEGFDIKNIDQMLCGFSAIIKHSERQEGNKLLISFTHYDFEVIEKDNAIYCKNINIERG